MELDEIRSTAMENLEDVRNRQERIEEMEQDRDALLERELRPLDTQSS